MSYPIISQHLSSKNPNLSHHPQSWYVCYWGFPSYEPIVISIITIILNGRAVLGQLVSFCAFLYQRALQALASCLRNRSGVNDFFSVIE